MFIIMTWALVGLIAGGMLGGSLADLGANHRGDIGAIFVGLVTGAALGAAAGGFAGRALGRMFAGDARKLGFIAAGPWIASLALVIGIVAFGQLSESMRNPDMVRSDGIGLSLIYEIRLPPGAPAPASARSVSVELRTPGEVMEATSANLMKIDDRTVIQGHFWVYKAAPKRVVAFRIGDGPASLFTMNLAARPADRGGRWSSWQGPDVGDGAVGKSPRAPQPEELVEIRYAANY